MAEAKRDQNYVPSALGVSSVDNVTTLPFKIDPITGRLLADATGGSGTVTDFIFTDANGVVGVVTNSTTTPTLEISLTDITPSSIVATGSIRSNTSIIVEETGAGTDTITIQAPASISASYSLTLPVNDGDSGQFLSTDGSGVLSWSTPSGSGDVTAASNLTDEAIIIGDGGVKGVQSSSFTISTNDMIVPDGGAIIFTDTVTNVNVLNSEGSLIVTPTTSAEAATISVQPLDVDRTDDVAYRVLSYASGTDAEFAQFGWSVDAASFYVATIEIDSGTAQPLALSAGIANLGTQLVLNVNGSVTFGGDVDMGANSLTVNKIISDGSGGLLLEASNGTDSLMIGSGNTANATFYGAVNFGGNASPSTNDVGALGTSSTSWADLFLAEGGVINWDNGDITLTQTGNELALAGGNLDIGTNTLRIAGDIDIDGTPTSDDTWVGPSTNDYNAGATISQWEAVYLDSSSTWQLTDADAASTAGSVMVALATEAGTSSNPLRVALPGSFCRNDAWNWTVGGAIYLSTTPGALTQTAPSATDDVVRVVGWATNADTIFWNPSPDYITIV